MPAHRTPRAMRWRLTWPGPHPTSSTGSPVPVADAAFCGGVEHAPIDVELRQVVGERGGVLVGDGLVCGAHGPGIERIHRPQSAVPSCLPARGMHGVRPVHRVGTLP